MMKKHEINMKNVSSWMCVVVWIVYACCELLRNGISDICSSDICLRNVCNKNKSCNKSAMEWLIKVLK